MAYSKHPYDVYMIGTSDDHFTCLGCRLMHYLYAEPTHWKGKTPEEAIEHLRLHGQNEVDPNAIRLLESEIKLRDEALATREAETAAKRLKRWRKRAKSM